MTEKKNSRLQEMITTNNGRVKIKEERVLKYLLDNEDHIQDLTISDIAENADVSKATVVRFCKALDFNGLKDFKVWYEAGKGSKFNKVQELKGDEDPGVIADVLKDAAVGTLERTLTEENMKVMAEMVEKIRSSREISIVGLGEEKVYAEGLAAVITGRYPEKKVEVNGDADNPPECSIVISLSGIDRGAITYLTNAVISGGVVYAVTADASSLIGKAASGCLALSDELLFSPDRHLLGRFALSAAVSSMEILLAKD